MKNKGQSVPREGKYMSNFNDLYDHVAADRTRAIQLLGIQDIRRKAIAELLAANAYTEPANIDAMTEQEREQHKAEAAYALGRPHILEVAQVPAPNSDETYAMAVGATSAPVRRGRERRTRRGRAGAEHGAGYAARHLPGFPDRAQ